MKIVCGKNRRKECRLNRPYDYTIAAKQNEQDVYLNNSERDECRAMRIAFYKIKEVRYYDR